MIINSFFPINFGPLLKKYILAGASIARILGGLTPRMFGHNSITGHARDLSFEAN